VSYTRDEYDISLTFWEFDAAFRSLRKFFSTDVFSAFLGGGDAPFADSDQQLVLSIAESADRSCIVVLAYEAGQRVPRQNYVCVLPHPSLLRGVPPGCTQQIRFGFLSYPPHAALTQESLLCRGMDAMGMHGVVLVLNSGDALRVLYLRAWVREGSHTPSPFMADPSKIIDLTKPNPETPDSFLYKHRLWMKPLPMAVTCGTATDLCSGVQLESQLTFDADVFVRHKAILLRAQHPSSTVLDFDLQLLQSRDERHHNDLACFVLVSAKLELSTSTSVTGFLVQLNLKTGTVVDVDLPLGLEKRVAEARQAPLSASKLPVRAIGASYGRALLRRVSVPAVERVHITSNAPVLQGESLAHITNPVFPVAIIGYDSESP